MEDSIKTISRHRNRLEGFITYDLEERTEEEQKIILELLVTIAIEKLKEMRK